MSQPVEDGNLTDYRPLFSDTPAFQKDVATAMQQDAARREALRSVNSRNETYNEKMRAAINGSEFCCVPGCTSVAHGMPWDPEYYLCSRHTTQAMEYGKRAGLDPDEPFDVSVARRITRDHQQGTNTGWVYYVAQADRIKIGYATDVKRRVKDYGPTAKLLAVEPGNRDLETQRHQQFRGHLADGREWFYDALPIREHIKSLARFGDVSDLAYTYRKHNRDGVVLAHTDTKKARHLG